MMSNTKMVHQNQKEDDDNDSSSEDSYVGNSTNSNSAADSSLDNNNNNNNSSANTKAASALLISASDKAGMAGIDRERINAILMRESGKSDFMKRQMSMDDNVNQKIQDMKQQLEEKDNASMNKDWRKEMNQSIVDPLLHSIRLQRRPLSTCVVIDMDSFFISCHILDNPHLADIPACVGGTSMISTSNYVARQYGVRAAMPGYLGSTLVKELSNGSQSLTFVKSDFDLYKRKSAEVRAVLSEYDPHLSMYSLDEAYLDVSSYLEVQLLDQTGLSHDDIHKILLHKSTLDQSAKQNIKQSTTQSIKNDFKQPLHERVPISTIHAAARDLLHSIRQKVKDTTGLTCSAGLCSNYLLAKVASDMNKPNGQYFVGPTEKEIIDFVNPLATRKICGIGRVMEKTLRGACDVETIKDLFDKRAEVYLLFKPASAKFLLRASIGYSDSNHRDSTAEDESDDAEEALNRKGISHERTFSPTPIWSEMCTKLEGITLALVQDLRQRFLRPKTITLKIKLANFHILSRSTTRDIALFENCNQRQSSIDLVDIVINLLKEAKHEYENGKKNKAGTTSTSKTEIFSVRLLGVRCSNFQLGKDNQSSLDQYRLARGLDSGANKPSELTQSSKPNSKRASSPMVKNPYVSPKRMNKSSERRISEPNSRVSSEWSPPAGLKSDDTQTVNEKQDIGTHAQVQCPICNRSCTFDEVNSHIDSCLNTTTVKQLAKEETQCADERSKKKKRRLADFFGS